MVFESQLFLRSRLTTTALKQPREVGYYSSNAGGEYKIQDDVNLSYYYLPDADIEKQIDLSAGVRKFQDEQAESGHDTGSLQGLLQTLLEYEQRKGKKVHADIVTFRGQMKQLIYCAFGGQPADVDMYVMSFDGQLFIRSTRKKLAHPSAARDSWPYRAYYSGYKFESIAFLDRPVAETPREVLEKRSKQVVSNSAQYITVVKTGVGNHKLVLGAEVDGIFDFREPASDNLKHYVELKVAKGVQSYNDARNFERKLFAAWLQCFLVGINRVIFGYRDDNFILRSVEEFSTSEIPLLLKNNPQLRNACVDAIKWYGALTKWLCELPRGPEDDFKVYKLSCANNHLKLSQLDATHEDYDGLVNGDDFIPASFREWRRSLNST
ncbi:AaceriAFR262Cp [[Ashbya] aceris (nom. inval.)]|nr:AaceriAFR262Cp [[Ashbya] aceris (nom. inval.)]